MTPFKPNDGHLHHFGVSGFCIWCGEVDEGWEPCEEPVECPPLQEFDL